MTLPRFYPILDTRTLSACGVDTFEAADAITAAGAGILQFRHKQFFDRSTFAAAERVAALCARRGALFVLNDRADFARLLSAALHLGQEDLAPADARRVVGPATPIGYSTHNADQLRAASNEPVDYLAIGPVFGTGSKENPDPVLGVEALRQLRPLTDRPLVAIGGITRANAADVLAAGADSVAIIGDLYPPGASAASIGQRAEDWLRITNAHN